MKKKFIFPFNMALASAMINLVLVYLAGVLISMGELTGLKIFLFYVLQFGLLVFVPLFFLSGSFKGYLHKCQQQSVGTIAPENFWKWMALFYLLFLLVFFQLVPPVTGYMVSDLFGSYLDRFFASLPDTGNPDERFAKQSFLVQNVFLCGFGFILSVLFANAYYRKLNRLTATNR